MITAAALIYVISTFDAYGAPTGTIRDFDTLRDCVSFASSLLPMEVGAACYAATADGKAIGRPLWKRNPIKPWSRNL